MLPERKVIALRRRAKHGRHAPWSGAVAKLDERVAELERRMTAFDRRIAVLGRHARMQVSFVFSVLIHIVIIFGVTFTMTDLSQFNRLDQPLEVTLVNSKSQKPPVKADALAQANLDGGGNTDEKVRAASPLPVPAEHKPTPEVTMAQKRVKKLEREAKRLMTRAKKAPAAVPLPQPQPQPRAIEAEVAPNAADIMARSLEIARLEARISKRWNAYQQRPRRRFVGARTKEFRFARYIEDWRLKIERIGELNYPQAARERRIYGSLVVTVSIKADGSLEGVDINRSSGEKILDQAALRIVHLAAPYAPFSADIAKDTDVLSITRTWLFTRADQFVSE
ncbi:MAG: energy transducer TonB [Betaproteobacteria bacterium]|nr:energy transducer TonB [Betaproteobacteria bacterium]MDH3435833.1 energy transducer TonB [Betaproteobacteria bacterium]